MSPAPHRVGHRVEDFCRPCRSQRAHTIQVVGGDGEPQRVMCDTCGSQHNYRGARMPAVRAPARERQESSDMSYEEPSTSEPVSDLESTLRRILREEAGIPPTAPAEKWRGGELVLRPGRAGLQEKSIPVDTFFQKVVAVRNKLRVLEQQVNGSDLPADQKLKLQGYITGCYGSLTSFNVLFADDDDKFKGATKA